MEAHAIPGHTPRELIERLEALGFEVHPTYPLVAFNRAYSPVEPAGDTVSPDESR